MKASVGIDCNKAKVVNQNVSPVPMMSMTTRLSHINMCRLPGRGPHDHCNQWLEIYGEMAENHLQW